MVDSLHTLASLRATRWFTDEAVNDDVLRAILETARWTGSARNRQPWRFHTVRSAATRDELSRCGAYAVHLRLAPVVLLLAIDRSWSDAEFDGCRVAQNIMLAAHELDSARARRPSPRSTTSNARPPSRATPTRGRSGPASRSGIRPRNRLARRRFPAADIR